MEESLLQPDFLKALERLRLAGKRIARSGREGAHASPRRGCSLEFSDYRRYQSGDDLRYVDWNVYSRLNRLFLKLFTAEEEMNIYLLVDVSLSMEEGKPQKLRFAKSVAAALGYVGLTNMDRVGGASFSSDLESVLPVKRGKKQILTLFEFLGRLSCGKETNLAQSVTSFLNVFPRPGLVVLLSDLFDPHGCWDGLKAFHVRGYDLLVIHIVDPSETMPESRGDLSLYDVESGRMKKLFLDEDLVQRFREELERYFEELISFCVRYGIKYLRTAPATPLEDFVLLALSRSGNVV